MLTQHLQQIDWRRPWLDPWRAPGQAVAQAVAAGASLPGALNREQAARQRMPCGDLGVQAPGAAAQAGRSGIEFVPQAALPPGMGYEHYLFQSGQCPTRENLHDFFNGLCWLRFSQTKQKINRLHAAELAGTQASASPGAKPPRGPVRDALTVLDENGAVLLAPTLLWDALAARDWRRLFVTLRPLWKEAQLVLFGHALLEKLVSPRKGITAHVYLAHPAINSIAQLDAWLAGDLSAARLADKPFLPLPVLGVPGWWAGNEDFSFYDDATVFRPRR